MRILAGAKRHRIEPLAYVSALLTASSSEEVDLESLLPDIGIAAHPEHLLTHRRDEAEVAASARRRRTLRRAKTRESRLTPWRSRLGSIITRARCRLEPSHGFDQPKNFGFFLQ